MTGMRTSLKLKVLMCGFRTGRIVDIVRILALEVLGEHSMERAAMHMARIPMTMISFGMHVEEWNHEHPKGRPQEDQHPRTRWLVANLSH